MTTIPDAFVNVPSRERTKVQALVPSDWHEKVFYKILPLRGAQARLLGNLIKWFVDELQARGGGPDQFLPDNERIANSILSDLAGRKVLP